MRPDTASPSRARTAPEGETSSARPATSRAVKPKGKTRGTGSPPSAVAKDIDSPSRIRRTGSTAASGHPLGTPGKLHSGGIVLSESGAAPSVSGGGSAGRPSRYAPTTTRATAATPTRTTSLMDRSPAGWLRRSKAGAREGSGCAWLLRRPRFDLDTERCMRGMVRRFSRLTSRASARVGFDCRVRRRLLPEAVSRRSPDLRLSGTPSSGR